MPAELTVPPADAGERLDKFLVRHIHGRSRSQLQKLITSGQVTVNDATVSAHYAVKSGDRLTINERVELETRLPARDVPAPTILYEDDDLMVLNKPAGLTVHPGAGISDPTLVDWIRQHAPSITTVGDDPSVRPGIVHRLDRDVSGVMVVAKTQAAFEHLKRQFQDRRVEKEYLTLVYGLPLNPSGTIDFRIDRSKRQHGRMAAQPVGGEGREARTHYVVERRVKNMALLRVTIETGRTHQIRVHLKAFGHPIVGDTTYTTKPHRRAAPPISRPFLHAARLAFTDLHNERREFTAPLPEDLRRFLDA